MANSALIDDLERQFADNPRRVFARLANEYRKVGDLERAIAYCRAHIPQAPNYISGYIVLGQALYDSRRYEEARQTFDAALSLDPENVIALRQLGDIASQSGDPESARHWYQRLLEVDPQNADVLAQVQALRPQAAPPAPEPVAAPEVADWGTISFDSAVDPTVAPLSGEDELLDEALPQAEGFTAGAFYVSAGSNATEVEPHEPAPGGEPAPDMRQGPDELPASPAHADVGPWAMEDVPGEAGLPASVESYGLIECAGIGEEDADDVIAPMYDPSIGRTVEPDGAEEMPPAPLFVTETMADLYLQQGFTGEAIAIYRQLLEQRPDDEDLRERLARVERGDVGATGGDDERRDAPAAIPADASSTSARSFFRALAGRRPPRSQSGVNGGSAGHSSASDGLFGDARVEGADDEAARWLAGAFSEDYRGNGGGQTDAVATLSLDEVFRSAPAGEASTRDDARVAHDEFFGGSASPAASGTTSAPAASGSENQDIDQFHAWLDGLKK